MLVRDEDGGEVLEYALIAGLIVIGPIALIFSVGGKIVCALELPWINAL